MTDLSLIWESLSVPLGLILKDKFYLELIEDQLFNQEPWRRDETSSRDETSIRDKTSSKDEPRRRDEDFVPIQLEPEPEVDQEDEELEDEYKEEEDIKEEEEEEDGPKGRRRSWQRKNNQELPVEKVGDKEHIDHFI